MPQCRHHLQQLGSGDIRMPLGQVDTRQCQGCTLGQHVRWAILLERGTVAGFERRTCIGRIARPELCFAEEQAVLQRQRAACTGIALTERGGFPQRGYCLRPAIGDRQQLAVVAHCRRYRSGVARKGALPLEGVSQQRLGVAQIPRAQLQGAGVAEHDLRIETLAQPQCLVDRACLTIGGERFVESVSGGQRDREGVVEDGRLAMDAAGHRDSLSDRLPLGRNGALQVAAAALQPRADAQSFEPLFVIAAGRLRPVRLCLVEQLARASRHYRAAAPGSPASGVHRRPRRGLRPPRLRQVALQQRRTSLCILQRVIEVRKGDDQRTGELWPFTVSAQQMLRAGIQHGLGVERVVAVFREHLAEQSSQLVSQRLLTREVAARDVALDLDSVRLPGGRDQAAREGDEYRRGGRQRPAVAAQEVANAIQTRAFARCHGLARQYAQDVELERINGGIPLTGLLAQRLSNYGIEISAQSA